jgi:hypothetical protein
MSNAKRNKFARQKGYGPIGYTLLKAKTLGKLATEVI